MDDNEPIVTVTRVTGFGGLSGVGVSARFRRTGNDIVITRAAWEIVIGIVGLLGFLLVPLYMMGSEGIDRLLAGDFGGDRIFVVIIGPFVLLSAFLFARSAIYRRATARISGTSRTIHYRHPGYDERSIAADEIASIGVAKRIGSASSSVAMGRDYCYAIVVRLKHGVDVDIASHRNQDRIIAMARQIAGLLGVPATAQSDKAGG